MANSQDNPIEINKELKIKLEKDEPSINSTSLFTQVCVKEEITDETKYEIPDNSSALTTQDETSTDYEDEKSENSTKAQSKSYLDQKDVKSDNSTKQSTLINVINETTAEKFGDNISDAKHDKKDKKYDNTTTLLSQEDVMKKTTVDKNFENIPAKRSTQDNQGNESTSGIRDKKSVNSTKLSTQDGTKNETVEVKAPLFSRNTISDTTKATVNVSAFNAKLNSVFSKPTRQFTSDLSADAIGAMKRCYVLISPKTPPIPKIKPDASEKSDESILLKTNNVAAETQKSILEEVSKKVLIVKLERINPEKLETLTKVTEHSIDYYESTRNITIPLSEIKKEKMEDSDEDDITFVNEKILPQLTKIKPEESDASKKALPPKLDKHYINRIKQTSHSMNKAQQKLYAYFIKLGLPLDEAEEKARIGAQTEAVGGPEEKTTTNSIPLMTSTKSETDIVPLGPVINPLYKIPKKLKPNDVKFNEPSTSIKVQIKAESIKGFKETMKAIDMNLNEPSTSTRVQTKTEKSTIKGFKETIDSETISVKSMNAAQRKRYEYYVKSGLSHGEAIQEAQAPYDTSNKKNISNLSGESTASSIVLNPFSQVQSHLNTGNSYSRCFDNDPKSRKKYYQKRSLFYCFLKGNKKPNPIKILDSFDEAEKKMYDFLIHSGTPEEKAMTQVIKKFLDEENKSTPDALKESFKCNTGALLAAYNVLKNASQFFFRNILQSGVSQEDAMKAVVKELLNTNELPVQNIPAVLREFIPQGTLNYHKPLVCGKNVNDSFKFDSKALEAAFSELVTGKKLFHDNVKAGMSQEDAMRMVVGEIVNVEEVPVSRLPKALKMFFDPEKLTEEIFLKDQNMTEPLKFDSKALEMAYYELKKRNAKYDYFFLKKVRSGVSQEDALRCEVEWLVNKKGIPVFSLPDVLKQLILPKETTDIPSVGNRSMLEPFKFNSKALEAAYNELNTCKKLFDNKVRAGMPQEDAMRVAVKEVINVEKVPISRLPKALREFSAPDKSTELSIGNKNMNEPFKFDSKALEMAFNELTKTKSMDIFLKRVRLGVSQKDAMISEVRWVVNTRGVPVSKLSNALKQFFVPEKSTELLSAGNRNTAEPFKFDSKALEEAYNELTAGKRLFDNKVKAGMSQEDAMREVVRDIMDVEKVPVSELPKTIKEFFAPEKSTEQPLLKNQKLPAPFDFDSIELETAYNELKTGKIWFENKVREGISQDDAMKEVVTELVHKIGIPVSKLSQSLQEFYFSNTSTEPYTEYEIMKEPFKFNSKALEAAYNALTTSKKLFDDIVRAGVSQEDAMREVVREMVNIEKVPIDKLHNALKEFVTPEKSTKQLSTESKKMKGTFEFDSKALETAYYELTKIKSMKIFHNRVKSGISQKDAMIAEVKWLVNVKGVPVSNLSDTLTEFLIPEKITDPVHTVTSPKSFKFNSKALEAAYFELKKIEGCSEIFDALVGINHPDEAMRTMVNLLINQKRIPVNDLPKAFAEFMPMKKIIEPLPPPVFNMELKRLFQFSSKVLQDQYYELNPPNRKVFHDLVKSGISQEKAMEQTTSPILENIDSQKDITDSEDVVTSLSNSNSHFFTSEAIKAAYYEMKKPVRKRFHYLLGLGYSQEKAIIKAREPYNPLNNVIKGSSLSQVVNKMDHNKTKPNKFTWNANDPNNRKKLSTTTIDKGDQPELNQNECFQVVNKVNHNQIKSNKFSWNASDSNNRKNLTTSAIVNESQTELNQTEWTKRLSIIDKSEKDACQASTSSNHNLNYTETKFGNKRQRVESHQDLTLDELRAKRKATKSLHRWTNPKLNLEENKSPLSNAYSQNAFSFNINAMPSFLGKNGANLAAKLMRPSKNPVTSNLTVSKNNLFPSSNSVRSGNLDVRPGSYGANLISSILKNAPAPNPISTQPITNPNVNAGKSLLINSPMYNAAFPRPVGYSMKNTAISQTHTVTTPVICSRSNQSIKFPQNIVGVRQTNIAPVPKPVSTVPIINMGANSLKNVTVSTPIASLPPTNLSINSNISKPLNYQVPPSFPLSQAIASPNFTPKPVNVSGQSLSYLTQNTSNVTLGIIPVGYPLKKFSDEQIRLVEKSILKKVLDQRNEDFKPGFLGNTNKSGWLTVECCDHETANWLISKQEELNPWKDARIIVVYEENIPRFTILKGLFPESNNESDYTILSLVQSMNLGLITEEWQVVSRETIGKNTYLTLAVDPISAEILKKDDYKLRYMFGEIQLKPVNNQSVDSRQYPIKIGLSKTPKGAENNTKRIFDGHFYNL